MAEVACPVGTAAVEEPAKRGATMPFAPCVIVVVATDCTAETTEVTNPFCSWTTVVLGDGTAAMTEVAWPVGTAAVVAPAMTDVTMPFGPLMTVVLGEGSPTVTVVVNPVGAALAILELADESPPTTELLNPVGAALAMVELADGSPKTAEVIVPLDPLTVVTPTIADAIDPADAAALGETLVADGLKAISTFGLALSGACCCLK